MEESESIGLWEPSDQENSKLSEQYDITFDIISSISISNPLGLLVNHARELVDAEIASMFLIDNSTGMLYYPILATEGVDAETKAKNKFSVRSSLVNYAISEKKSIRLPDPTISNQIRNAGILDDNALYGSILCVPMTIADRVIGAFEVSERKSGIFTKADQYILEIISAYIALYIEKELIYSRLKKREQKEKKLNIKRLIQLSNNFSNIIGKSDKLLDAIKMAQQVACTEASVLIYGETGTGKEIMARAIHRSSSRSSEDFVAINCGAIPETLLESELFGYEKGAFTNAFTRRIGRLQEANNGTIFLDEIGDMPLNLQVKLLRVLEEGLVRPLGGSQDITVNIRVISATHQNLRDLIAKNEFRKDLYYRLKVFELDLPPLRDRKEDIPSLAEHFMDIHNQKVGKNVKTISPSAMDILCNYDFPGNVRELQNIIERAVIITDGDTITTDSLPTETAKSNNIMSHNSTYKPQDYEELKAAKIEAQMDVERMFIIETLSKYNGNVSKAAHQVNMNRSWLAQLAKKHSIDPARFRIHV